MVQVGDELSLMKNIIYPTCIPNGAPHENVSSQKMYKIRSHFKEYVIFLIIFGTLNTFAKHLLLYSLTSTIFNSK